MTPAAQSKSLKDRLLQEAARDRERAETLPPGAERDALKKRQGSLRLPRTLMNGYHRLDCSGRSRPCLSWQPLPETVDGVCCAVCNSDIWRKPSDTLRLARSIFL